MIQGDNQEVYNQEIIAKVLAFYEERLKDTVKNIFKKINEDELIQNRNENQTSSLLIEQKIKEIIQNNLLQEKEIKIVQLTCENKIFQDQLEKLELDNQTFSSSIQQVNNLMNHINFKGSFNLQDNQQNEIEQNKNNQQIQQLMQKLSYLEEQYKSKDNKIQKVDREKQTIKMSENDNLDQQSNDVEQLEKQNQQQMYDETTKKYQLLNEEFETLRYRYEYICAERIKESEQYKLLIDQIYSKCKDKTHVLKQKYKQYKELSKELQDKLIQSEKNTSEKISQNNEIKQKINDSQLEMNYLLKQIQLQKEEIENLQKCQSETSNNLLNKIGLNDKCANSDLEESQFMAEQSIEITQTEKEKLHLEARLKGLNIKYKELEEKLKFVDEQQIQYEKRLTEKESALNQQKNLISEIKSQQSKEKEQQKLEIKRLVESQSQKEKQFSDYKKQYQEQTKNKLILIQNQLQQSKQDINILQQKFIDQINETYGKVRQIIQNVMQFYIGQKIKLKEQYENELQKSLENISKKFELQQEKQKAVLYEKELFYKKQIIQLEQKIFQLNSRTQDEKNIIENEQTQSDLKKFNEKLTLNMNGINAFKNQFIKSECYSARSVDRNQKHIQIEQFKNSVIKSQSKYHQSMKNQISENEKKVSQILDQGKDKIDNMKSNPRSIEFEDSSDQFINSISSNSSVTKVNNCITPVPRNNSQDTHKTPEQIDQQKKEQQNRFKQNKFEQLMRSTNYANSQAIQSAIKNRSSSKNKQVNNFMEMSAAFSQKSPSLTPSNNSYTNRNRSSTNHLVQSVDLNQKNDQSIIRQKNSSASSVYNDALKNQQHSSNSPSYKKTQQIKEEYKLSNRQFNSPNPSIFSPQKIDKTLSSSVTTPLQNNLDNSEISSQKCELSGSDAYQTIFRNQETLNYFANSPNAANKQQQQINNDSLIQPMSNNKDKSRSNTPTYLSVLADKSLQELKLEIIKQKQRITISRNNSSEISSQQNISHSSNIIPPNNEQVNSINSQFLIQNKYNNIQAQQNEQQDISTSVNQISLSSSQQTPVKINLTNFKNYKFVSPNQSKLLQAQQQKLLQQSSQQNSKSKQGQQLEINDL